MINIIINKKEMKMVETNKSQTASESTLDPETGKPLVWHDRYLYTFPNGKKGYLTKREKQIADKINKLYAEGKISNVVSVGSMNQFFRQRYILALDDYESFFAKHYYKSYILDFVKFNKDQERRQRKLQRPGEE
jgi:hypothetical protein